MDNLDAFKLRDSKMEKVLETFNLSEDHPFLLNNPTPFDASALVKASLELSDLWWCEISRMAWPIFSEFSSESYINYKI